MTTLPIAITGKTAFEVARECSADARKLMCDGFGRTAVSAVKGRGNVLTEVDLAVERAVMTRLSAEFPAHAILSEETAATTRSDGWLWVIDPIDGTKNFSRGIPHFCFTMALCEAAVPILALTLQPLLNEEFAAVAGGGCMLNGRPVRVSTAETVQESVLALDLGYLDARGARQLDLARKLWPGMQGLRISGSAALGFAFVAAARWDIFVHSNLMPWDSAAGLLLVREAGGLVTDRDGGPATIFSEGVVAAAPGVHADFIARTADTAWRD